MRNKRTTPQRSEGSAEYEEPPDFLGEEPQYGDETSMTEPEAQDQQHAAAAETQKQAPAAAAAPKARNQAGPQAVPESGRRASRRPRAQKRVTLEEAYGSSSQEDGEGASGAEDNDDTSSVSALDLRDAEEVPDSDCSSDASLASEAESAGPPAKRKAPAGKKGATARKDRRKSPYPPLDGAMESQWHLHLAAPAEERLPADGDTGPACGTFTELPAGSGGLEGSCPARSKLVPLNGRASGPASGRSLGLGRKPGTIWSFAWVQTAT
ncbi:hypothetical protein WJX84_008809 [Apatococcus fuscideae]|uniref:Uncharacterized protein n=1 Tax=Apatococcus fuscideae TaxID=2026836 RepID=A0AAW1TEK0_9CHLO